ncbi:MAG: Corrinoid/iron-sulfur protein large subunit [Chloroflexi bacterium ADurb.Bin325]|nr:MAG: Corrinoid/iron-sulfur protein large subunit [Chloroflexi bacterium ADurb.Bin325]
MALSGLEIYKLLPASSKDPAEKAHGNCKECGYPTCLAFAMKLAAKQAELAACKYISEASKAKLSAAAQPPIRLITLAADGRSSKAGNEIVLFRHEKTFYNPAGIFVRVADTLPADEIRSQAQAVADYKVDYVGLALRLDGVAVEVASGDPAQFAAAVAAASAAQIPLILMAEDPAVMAEGLAQAGGVTPLLCAVAHTFADSLSALTQLRRLALKKNFRPLGYPAIAFPYLGGGGADMEMILAGQQIAKYAGFVVLSRFEPAEVYPLLVLRANLFTDPQKPIQVEPGVYPINKPTADAPVLVTTNFSITYFAVANEMESSGLPAWLLVADAEGMSVLTAWAAGKFDAEKIAKTVKGTSIADQVAHRKVVIPGHVAVLMGELEEELPDWQIKVGPREAVDLPRFLKTAW